MTLSQALGTWGAWSDFQITDLASVDHLLKVASNLPEDAFQTPTLEDISDLLDKKLESLKASIVDSIATRIENQIKAVNLEVEKFGSKLDELETNVNDVKTDISNSVLALDSSVTKSMGALNKSVEDFDAALRESLENTTTDLKNELTSVESTFKGNITTVLEQTRGAFANLSKEMSDLITGTETALSSSVNMTRESLTTLLTELDSKSSDIFSKLSLIVSDIESSESIKDIRAKVSAYYDSYGNLVASLTELLSKVTVSYREWLSEVEKATLYKLEVADALDAVEVRMKDLLQHEDKLDSLMAQMDQLHLFSNQLSALNSHWEADHVTIEKFNEIVKKQEVYSKTQMASNIGVALTGIADAVSAGKSLSSKSKAF